MTGALQTHARAQLRHHGVVQLLGGQGVIAALRPPLPAGKAHVIVAPGTGSQWLQPGQDLRADIGAVEGPGVIAAQGSGALDEGQPDIGPQRLQAQGKQAVGEPAADQDDGSAHGGVPGWLTGTGPRPRALATSAASSAVQRPRNRAVSPPAASKTSRFGRAVSRAKVSGPVVRRIHQHGHTGRDTLAQGRRRPLEIHGHIGRAGPPRSGNAGLAHARAGPAPTSRSAPGAARSRRRPPPGRHAGPPAKHCCRTDRATRGPRWRSGSVPADVAGGLRPPARYSGRRQPAELLSRTTEAAANGSGGV